MRLFCNEKPKEEMVKVSLREDLDGDIFIAVGDIDIGFLTVIEGKVVFEALLLSVNNGIVDTNKNGYLKVIE